MYVLIEVVSACGGRGTCEWLAIAGSLYMPFCASTTWNELKCGVTYSPGCCPPGGFWYTWYIGAW